VSYEQPRTKIIIILIRGGYYFDNAEMQIRFNKSEIIVFNFKWLYPIQMIPKKTVFSHSLYWDRIALLNY
jgi:hypothetical protein